MAPVSRAAMLASLFLVLICPPETSARRRRPPRPPVNTTVLETWTSAELLQYVSDRGRPCRGACTEERATLLAVAEDTMRSRYRKVRRQRQRQQYDAGAAVPPWSSSLSQESQRSRQKGVFKALRQSRHAGSEEENYADAAGSADRQQAADEDRERLLSDLHRLKRSREEEAASFVWLTRGLEVLADTKAAFSKRRRVGKKAGSGAIVVEESTGIYHRLMLTQPRPFHVMVLFTTSENQTQATASTITLDTASGLSPSPPSVPVCDICGFSRASFDAVSDAVRASSLESKYMDLAAVDTTAGGTNDNRPKDNAGGGLEEGRRTGHTMQEGSHARLAMVVVDYASGPDARAIFDLHAVTVVPTMAHINSVHPNEPFCAKSFRLAAAGLEGTDSAQYSIGEQLSASPGIAFTQVDVVAFAESYVDPRDRYGVRGGSGDTVVEGQVGTDGKAGLKRGSYSTVKGDSVKTAKVAAATAAAGPCFSVRGGQLRQAVQRYGVAESQQRLGAFIMFFITLSDWLRDWGIAFCGKAALKAHWQLWTMAAVAAVWSALHCFFKCGALCERYWWLCLCCGVFWLSSSGMVFALNTGAAWVAPVPASSCDVAQSLLGEWLGRAVNPDRGRQYMLEGLVLAGMNVVSAMCLLQAAGGGWRCSVSSCFCCKQERVTSNKQQLRGSERGYLVDSCATFVRSALAVVAVAAPVMAHVAYSVKGQQRSNP